MSSSKERSWFAWEQASLVECRRLEAIDLLFRHDERLLRFLFDFSHPRLRVPSGALLREAKSLPKADEVLVSAAIDIWNGEGSTGFNRLLAALNDDELCSFVRALCHLKDIRNAVMHGLIDDENGGFCL